MRISKYCACLLLLALMWAPGAAHAQPHYPPIINGWEFVGMSTGIINYELTYTNITEAGQIFSMTSVPMNEPALSSISMYASWRKHFPADSPFASRPMPDAFKAEFKIADVSRLKEVLVDLSYFGSGGEQLGPPVKYAKLNLSTDWQTVTRPVDPGTGKEFSHVKFNFMVYTADPSQITVFATVKNLNMVFGGKEVVLDSLMQRVSGVPENTVSNLIPTSPQLLQNYPNPFNPSTIIPYTLSEAEDVDLRVYDLLGREVAVLERSYQPAGTHETAFDGSRLPSGTYCAVLRVGGKPAGSRKLLLVK